MSKIVIPRSHTVSQCCPHIQFLDQGVLLACMPKDVRSFVCLAKKDSVDRILTIVVVAFIVCHIERLDKNTMVIPLFGLK